MFSKVPLLDTAVCVLATFTWYHLDSVGQFCLERGSRFPVLRSKSAGNSLISVVTSAHNSSAC